MQCPEHEQQDQGLHRNRAGADHNSRQTYGLRRVDLLEEELVGVALGRPRGAHPRRLVVHASAAQEFAADEREQGWREQEQDEEEHAAAIPV